MKDIASASGPVLFPRVAGRKQKKLLMGAFVSLVLVIVVLLSVRSISRFGQVKFLVSGTPGLSFTGSCRGTDSKGRPLAQNLSGVVPREFLVDARTLQFTLQGMHGPGSLGVTVRRGGSEVTTVSARGVQGRVDALEISADAF